jgi:hypothetical protein
MGWSLSRMEGRMRIGEATRECVCQGVIDGDRNVEDCRLRLRTAIVGHVAKPQAGNSGISSRLYHYAVTAGTTTIPSPPLVTFQIRRAEEITMIAAQMSIATISAACVPA